MRVGLTALTDGILRVDCHGRRSSILHPRTGCVLAVLLGTAGVWTEDVVTPHQPPSTQRRPIPQHQLSALSDVSPTYLKMVRSPTWSTSSWLDVKLEGRKGKAPTGSLYSEPADSRAKINTSHRAFIVRRAVRSVPVLTARYLLSQIKLSSAGCAPVLTFHSFVYFSLSKVINFTKQTTIYQEIHQHY